MDSNWRSGEVSRLDLKLRNVMQRCHAVSVLGRGDRGATVPPSSLSVIAPMSGLILGMGIQCSCLQRHQLVRA